MTGLIDLDLIDLRNKPVAPRSPFPHQKQAFEALNNSFTLPMNEKKGALIVLPTGGGKTFTATNWICRNILSRDIKVLWLAQSSYLLDQAKQSFIREAHNIGSSRGTLKIRTVSSSSAHANSGSIDLSDDVVIVTTQTAISDILKETTDFQGNSVKFMLHRWVNACENLFVVLDEAHHAPAFGCRSLLLKLKEIVPSMYLLGLTATPTHNDKRIRGWLDKIFDMGIRYQVSENDLIQDNILALPAYISKPTGRDMEVDDQTFKRIVQDHKDLPEAIVEKLARDSERNNFIINGYLQNRKLYGKTIIFADRWFQCEYIAQKLNENGIKADSIYVMVSSNRIASRDGTGRRDNKQNEATLRKFRDGALDVLVNVKMLTEGVDVPDVKTVMITRQTTSPILLKQMVGRALRGKKAGAGKDKEHANIVFFMDNWKRLLPFAGIANISGEAEDLRGIYRGIPPMEWVSILLVQRTCKDILFAGKEGLPSAYFLPVGWYDAEYTVSVPLSDDGVDGEEMLPKGQYVLVFESQVELFHKLIGRLEEKNYPEHWAKEDINGDTLWDELRPIVTEFVNWERDDVDGSLKTSILHIVRHVAQNEAPPEFIPLDIRDQYDIERLVKEFESLYSPQKMQRLKLEFEDERKYWKRLYKRFDWFHQAYHDAEYRLYCSPEINNVLIEEKVEPEQEKQPENLRSALLERDHRQCCCCKRAGKGVKLEIDHITPVKLNGVTEMDNLQILCSTCNRAKGTNIISFRNTKTQLRKPMPLDLFVANRETVQNSVLRIINFFYRASAVCEVQAHERRNGKYYSCWRVILHEGNPVEWLESHKNELLRYIRERLKREHVADIEIISI